MTKKLELGHSFVTLGYLGCVNTNTIKAEMYFNILSSAKVSMRNRLNRSFVESRAYLEIEDRLSRWTKCLK